MTTGSKRYSNLKERLFAGLAGSLIIIAAVSWSEWSYLVVLLLISGMSMREFYQLSELDGKSPLAVYGIISGLMIFIINFLVEMSLLDSKFYLLYIPLLSAVFFLVLYDDKRKKPFTAAAFTLLGIFYVAIPLTLFNVTAFSRGKYSFEIPLGILLMLWSSDTFAYFFGSRFGKRRLFERVSPKKSWEGFMGGTAGALGMCFIISYYFVDLQLWQWVVLSLITAVAGTYGDLIESLFKRSISIKDSASTIPGHGGFLDRFDGLLLIAPYAAVFLKLF
ncbi:phosphatidate cytidylyltransferase [Xanthovirga aplysinae]|uniref:phosphatidate cytidylyltransferase n=1 Tax=Xanthovirga aplysinae TaxID=2529853 RepID=UPI0012BB4E07|nr:phosphatidate cytidylyltransferase [Xanthovirga aplysinae]MTI30802.1 phosphatidate cytidylyltransferase [Xanthovirga aplysinae]